MPRITWKSLNRRIEKCKLCPRLIAHCEEIAESKRAAYRDQEYWGAPVGNFGDSDARLLIVGLAPGAHGANRTGRAFTGDRSGDWLFRALHRVGLSNRPMSVTRDDGLELRNCAITNVCRCAPPGNKPTRDELETCRPFLQHTISILPVTVYLALGRLAWKEVLDYAYDKELLNGKRPQFGHGSEAKFSNGQRLLGCYHPSQQNTFTGRLTEEMLDEVVTRAKKLARKPRNRRRQS